MYGVNLRISEFNFKKGHWRVERIEHNGQGATLRNVLINYWGDGNVAFSTIIQLIMQRSGWMPEVGIEERLRFTLRCFHPDNSRGGVPTVAKAREIIRWLFLLKYAHFRTMEVMFPRGNLWISESAGAGFHGPHCKKLCDVE